MKNKKKDLSISIYLLLFIVSVIIVVVLLLTISFRQVLKDSLLSVAQTNSEQSVTQVLNTIENYSNDIVNKMKSMSLIINESTDTFNIKEQMETMVNINEDIVSIIIYDMEGNILDYQSNTPLKTNFDQNLSFDKRLFNSNSEYVITSPHVQNLFDGEYPWVVTVCQKQWSSSHDKLVYVAMDIRFVSIARYIDDVGIGEHGYCFIVNKNDDLVYHPLQQLIYLDVKKEKIDEVISYREGNTINDGVIYTVKDVSKFDWCVVGVSYVDELVDDRAITAIEIIIIIALVVMIFAIIILFVLSNKLTKPVRSLVDAMSIFEKNAVDFKYTPVRGASEFNKLSSSFEHMVIQIQELMDKVKKEEVALRKTELKALQAQINPHFLYNTLDSIQWMCEEEKTEDAITMVGALAQLFRISISKGYELIPIEKEIQHAKNYLVIQSYRYKDQFTYFFDIDEEVLPYLCNKITIQPIIENALYHGISRMVDEGEILISVHKVNDDIIIKIKDNGVGMSEEQVESILKKERTDSKGIGVKNVNDRIKIYFGDDYGIVVESELDVGTIITIKIPAVMEDRYSV
ncbi:cache domain-containing sensor histidine kinase [Thomasclavelia cocleata]|uniref:cache domain-containing sensor histidine kinase n=1 Tax=Thomasclavelia cocleata TaxID=69824 RepID=UPI00249459AA|nr:sensor histidine kinase [Thomasclavelia cocleata]